MYIIGKNPVIETLQYSPHLVRKIYLLENVSDGRIRQIIKTAKINNIDVETRNKKDFERILNKKDKSQGISQGVIAEAEEYKYAELETMTVNAGAKRSSVILLLDEIQDPHNLGAIARTAAAAEADGIIITEKNSVKVNHTVVKASAGAVNYIPIALTKNVYKSIEDLKSAGFRILGTDLKARKSMYDEDLAGKVAIILGNEGQGIRKNILKLCDELLKIPIAGRIESLNVSVSAGLILYEALRQRKYG